MMRAALAVIAGYALWSGLWLGGNMVLSGAFPGPAGALRAGEPASGVGYFAAALGLSVFCSFTAGLLTASVAPTRAGWTVLSMASLLLLTGIFVQASVWTLMPIWYHVPFLALLVPIAVIGGRARA